MNKVACVFAGQGAQFPGMGKDLAEDHEIRVLFERADSVLGFGLSKICFEGSAEDLTRSDVCQPAIFVVSIAAHRVFVKQCPGVSFAMAAGLSLGEWSALHMAGVLDFDSTLKILEARGRFMQEACEAAPSGMISIMGATAEQIAAICERAGVTIANINSATQIVLSGTKPAVETAAAVAGEYGVKAIVLQVAGAFHSPLMNSAREKLGAILEEVKFSQPAIPVLANVSGQPHSDDPEAIRAAMLSQVTESVRWHDCIKFALDTGVGTFVEFGPGKVLSGLIKRIERSVVALNVQDKDSLDKTTATLAQ